MATSSFFQLSPYFHFRFDRKRFYVAGSTFRCLMDRSRGVIEVRRRQISVLPVSSRPSLVSSVETVADKSVHSTKVEYEVDGCELKYRLLETFPLPVYA